MSRSITAGVDFGNQSCVLSIPTKYGVDIIQNQSSNRKTPTMVSYQNERRYSGEFALQQQMMNINNTITNLKQLVGLAYHSKEREELSKFVPYKIVCLEDNGLSGIQLENGIVLRPEQIIAFLLKSLLEIIQMKNPKIQQLVVTVPSWWNELQRRVFLNAASIANVKVVSLLDSMAAAAVSYVKIHSDRFSDNEPEKKYNVMFIDIGDTSMDAAVAALSKKSIEIKGYAFDQTIGGQFFTQKLEEFLMQKIKEKYKVDPKANKRSLIRFHQATEKVKKALSANSLIMFEVPSLMNDIDVSIPVKREEYAELIQKNIENITATIEKVLINSNLKKEDIFAVEVLGGGSRIPAVKAQIKEFFGKEPNMSLDLDECFAIGAGFMAAKVDGYDIGIDPISSIYQYDFNIEYLEQSEDFLEPNLNIHRVNAIAKGTKIPTKTTVSVPILRKNSLCLMNNGSKIGCATLESGTNPLVDVNLDVSIDAFGLINLSNPSIKKKEVKKVENKETDSKKQAKDKNEENDNKKSQSEVNTKNGENSESGNKKVQNEINTKKAENVTDTKKTAKETAIKEKAAIRETKEVFKGSLSYSPVGKISDKTMDKYKKIEEEMALKDKQEIEIDNTKNELESLIFTTQSELNSITIENEDEKNEIKEIKEKVNEVFIWFDENEFERLSLKDYKTKISEMKMQISKFNEIKKYNSEINILCELKQKLLNDLEIVKNDKERLSLKDSIELQSEIPKQIEKIDEIVKLPKKEFCQIDIASIEKNVSKIDSRSKLLKNIPLIVKPPPKAQENSPRKTNSRQNEDNKSEKENQKQGKESNEEGSPSLNPPQKETQNLSTNSVENSQQKNKNAPQNDIGKNRIKVKKVSNKANINNTEQLIKSKTNRPSTNFQASRMKLPPLLPLEEEEENDQLIQNAKNINDIKTSLSNQNNTMNKRTVPLPKSQLSSPLHSNLLKENEKLRQKEKPSALPPLDPVDKNEYLRPKPPLFSHFGPIFKYPSL